MTKRCAMAVLAAAAISCAGTAGYCTLTCTRDMTIETAMDLVGRNLQSDQRNIVLAALRRQSLIAIRQIKKMTEDGNNGVAVNAKAALSELREELR